jgi:drug/metabolite transporter (DMT)-like permease
VQVIAGEWLELEEGSATRDLTTASLVAGAALALVGTLSVAIGMIMVQSTTHKLSNNETMVGVWVVLLSAMLVLALSIEGNDWTWLRSLDAYGWGVLVLGSLFLATGGLLLNLAVRNAGANSVAVLMPLRLIGSIIGGLILPPHVQLTSGLVIAGVVLIIVVVSGYFMLQVWLSARQQAQQAISTEPKEQQQP